MKYDGIIFDMDGTIWNTEKEVCLAWNKVLADAGHPKRVTGDELAGYMGLPMTEIAKRMFGTDNYDSVAELFGCCMQYENEYIAKHGAVLYPDLINTLKQMYTKIPLFIVSNCQSGYIEAFLDYYGFGKYFKDILCWGDTKVSKGESIKILMEKNGIEDAAYVGDIQGDCDSARFAGIKFIHAAYGFGSVKDKDAEIHTFAELLDVVE